MRVLAIVHQSDCGPGVFSDALAAEGATLEQWSPACAEGPPRDPVAYDAVITHGGAMHIDQLDQHSWLGDELAVLAQLVERRVPLLGVCLGAQLLAAAAGARVGRADSPEIGWYEVATTAEAGDDPLLAPLAPRFRALEWHSYAFTLPPGAVALARSATCLQGLRLRDVAWGIQFHAEVTRADFAAWLNDYRSDPDAVAVGLREDQLRAQTDVEIADWNELGQALCTRFLAAAASASR